MNSESQPAASETDAAPSADASLNAENAADENAVSDSPVAENAAAENAAAENAAEPKSQLARGAGPLAARGLGVAKPASPTVSTEQLEKEEAKSNKDADKKKKKRPPASSRMKGEREKPQDKPAAEPKRGKVEVPSLRADLSDDLMAEFEMELAGADVEGMLGGSAGMPDRKEPLADGTRVQAQVLKIHQDSVYVALGGPDEGAVPFEQFKEEPTIGQSIEVMVSRIQSRRRLVRVFDSRIDHRCRRLDRLGRRCGR